MYVCSIQSEELKSLFKSCSFLITKIFSFNHLHIFLLDIFLNCYLPPSHFSSKTFWVFTEKFHVCNWKVLNCVELFILSRHINSADFQNLVTQGINSLQNSASATWNDVWVAGLSRPSLSVSAFSPRSAPVEHSAGWQVEEQQGETDTVLVSFTLLLLPIPREGLSSFLSEILSAWTLEVVVLPQDWLSCLCVFYLPQSAAALCVGVGSFADPDDLPGLAHFLEHSKIL